MTREEGGGREEAESDKGGCKEEMGGWDGKGGKTRKEKYVQTMSSTPFHALYYAYYIHSV